MLGAAYAQNQLVLFKDSSFTSSNGGQTLQLQGVTTSAYNPDCSKHSDTTAVLNPTNNQLNNLSLTLYDYYSDGSLFHQTEQLTTNNGATYGNNSRETYTYTASKALATLLTERWNGSAWVPSQLVTNTYDANGFLIMSVAKESNTAGQTWTLVDSTTYFNNNKGQPDSSIAITSDTSSIKSYYTYNATTSLLSQLTSFIYENNLLTGGLRLTYFHDSANLVKKDSTIQEFYIPEGNTFLLQSTIVTNSTYNADHTLNNSITISKIANISTYSKTSFGYAPCSSVLPVTLFSFSGEQKNNNTILHWQTTNETNASYFSIQRSADAVNFTTIGKVKAAGNSSVLKDYTFTDANISLLNTQKLYYRLATTSNDGSISYTKIVSVSIAAGKFIISVSPNPFTNSINVNVPMMLQDVKVVISDVSGKIMYTAAPHILSGRLSIDASKFAKGVYIITIQSAGNKQAFKIVK